MVTNQQRKNNIKKVAKLAFYFICLTLFCLCSTIKMECPFLQNLFTNVLTILLFSFVSPEKSSFTFSLFCLLLSFVPIFYFLWLWHCTLLLQTRTLGHINWSIFCFTLAFCLCVLLWYGREKHYKEKKDGKINLTDSIRISTRKK